MKYFKWIITSFVLFFDFYSVSGSCEEALGFLKPNKFSADLESYREPLILRYNMLKELDRPVQDVLIEAIVGMELQEMSRQEISEKIRSAVEKCSR